MRCVQTAACVVPHCTKAGPGHMHSPRTLEGVARRQIQKGEIESGMPSDMQQNSQWYLSDTCSLASCPAVPSILPACWQTSSRVSPQMLPVRHRGHLGVPFHVRPHKDKCTAASILLLRSKIERNTLLRHGSAFGLLPMRIAHEVQTHCSSSDTTKCVKT